MAAPVLDDGIANGPQSVDESAVWDMYRALCGALTGSTRTEVWTELTDNRLPGTGDAESLLFRSAMSLILALRAEAAGLSPSDDLADAHTWLLEAVGLSSVRVR